MADVKVAVTRVACNTGTGNQDITISGFGTPKAAIFIVTKADLGDEGPTSLGVGASMGFGATDGTRQFGASVLSYDSSSSTNCKRMGSSSACIYLTDTSSVDAIAAFSTWVTDGVRINWSNAPADDWLLTVILLGGADLNAYVNNFNTNSSTSVQTVNTLSFTPTVLIANTTGALLNAARTNGYNFSLGFITSSSQRSQCTAEANGVSDGAPFSRVKTDAGIFTLNSSGNIENEIDFSNFTSTGFDYQCSAAVSAQVGYIALGGLTAAIGTYNPPTSATSDTLNPGFTPQFAMIGMNACATMDTTESDGDAGSVGVAAITATAQFVNVNAIEDLSAIADTCSLSDDVAIRLLDDDNTTNLYAATLTSLNSSGVNLSYSTASGTTRQWIYLAIEEATTPQSFIFKKYSTMRAMMRR